MSNAPSHSGWFKGDGLAGHVSRSLQIGLFHGCSIVSCCPMAWTRYSHSPTGSLSRPCWFQQSTSIQTYCRVGRRPPALHQSAVALATRQHAQQQVSPKDVANLQARVEAMEDAGVLSAEQAEAMDDLVSDFVRSNSQPVASCCDRGGLTDA